MSEVNPLKPIDKKTAQKISLLRQELKYIKREQNKVWALWYANNYPVTERDYSLRMLNEEYDEVLKRLKELKNR